jgi:hypothetical protein
MLDSGGDDLLFGLGRSRDDSRDAPCAITGGTGDSPGARPH